MIQTRSPLMFPKSTEAEAIVKRNQKIINLKITTMIIIITKWKIITTNETKKSNHPQNQPKQQPSTITTTTTTTPTTTRKKIFAISSHLQ